MTKHWVTWAIALLQSSSDLVPHKISDVDRYIDCSKNRRSSSNVFAASCSVISSIAEKYLKYKNIHFFNKNHFL